MQANNWMLWVSGGVWGVKLDAVLVAEVLAYTTRGVEEVLACSEKRAKRVAIRTP